MSGLSSHRLLPQGASVLLAQQPTTTVSGPPLLCNPVTTVIIKGSPAGQPHQLREMLYLRGVGAVITS